MLLLFFVCENLQRIFSQTDNSATNITNPKRAAIIMQDQVPLKSHSLNLSWIRLRLTRRHPKPELIYSELLLCRSSGGGYTSNLSTCLTHLVLNQHRHLAWHPPDRPLLKAKSSHVCDFKLLHLSVCFESLSSAVGGFSGVKRYMLVTVKTSPLHGYENICHHRTFLPSVYHRRGVK